jgi:hypothetical protein
MVGAFLATEANRLSSWPFTVLLPEIEAIRRHERREFAYGGDAYNVYVSPEHVRLFLAVEEPVEECVLPFEDFHAVLVDWRKHLLGRNSDTKAWGKEQQGKAVVQAAGTAHSFPGEKLTWAGECPWTRGLCFGTDSGKLLIPGHAEMDLHGHGVTSGVNEAAFARELIGVATPNEVVLVRASPFRSDFHVERRFDGGARGIVSTPTGNLVTACGESGVMLIRRDANQVAVRQISHETKAAIKYDRLIFSGRKSADVFTCAGGQKGLIAVMCEWSTWRTVIVGHPVGKKIIAVCSIKSHEYPLATAGISTDQTVLFTRDVTDERPIGITVSLSGGAARSIHSAEGHLIVVTDKVVHVFPSLAARFLRGESLDTPTPVAEMPAPTSLAHLVYDRFLVIGLGDGRALSIDMINAIEALRATKAHEHKSPQAEHEGGATSEAPAMTMPKVAKLPRKKQYKLRPQAIAV